MSPNTGGGGGVAGYAGAQTNFGDLTPYLTFAPYYFYQYEIHCKKWKIQKNLNMTRNDKEANYL